MLQVTHPIFRSGRLTLQRLLGQYRPPSLGTIQTLFRRPLGFPRLLRLTYFMPLTLTMIARSGIGVLGYFFRNFSIGPFLRPCTPFFSF